MTTYTAIPDSDIDPESPATTTLMTRLRDNPLAIAEGDASAPPIAYSALAAAIVAGGTTYDITPLVNATAADTVYTKAIEWTVSLSGSVNVYFELSGSGGACIYKDGSQVGTYRTSVGAYSEDVAVADGDRVQVYLKNNPFGSASVSNARLRNAATIPGSIVMSYPPIDGGTI